MTVSQISAIIKFGWTIAGNAVGAFSAPTQGPSTLSLNPTLSTSTYNVIASYRINLAAGANVDIDLQNLADSLGGTNVLTKVIGFMIASVFDGTYAVSAQPFSVKPGTANALVWFLTGTTPAIPIQAGGGFAVIDGATKTVDGTHKTINVLNSGAAAGQFDVCLIGGT